MDALNAPRPAKQPCPPHRVLPRNSKQTIRELITDNETNIGMIGFMKQIAKMKPKGPWREYLTFFAANQSGDVDTLKPEIKKYVLKMHKDLKSEWTKNQTGEEANATEQREVEESVETKHQNGSKGGKAN